MRSLYLVRHSIRLLSFARFSHTFLLTSLIFQSRLLNDRFTILEDSGKDCRVIIHCKNDRKFFAQNFLCKVYCIHLNMHHYSSL